MPQETQAGVRKKTPYTHAQPGTGWLESTIHTHSTGSRWVAQPVKITFVRKLFRVPLVSLSPKVIEFNIKSNTEWHVFGAGVKTRFFNEIKVIEISIRPEPSCSLEIASKYP